MLNMPGERNQARCPEMGHSPAAGLVMHWIDVCNNPVMHSASGRSTVADNPFAHKDQLVAEWIEQGGTRSAS